MAQGRRTPGSQTSLREANRHRILTALKKHGGLTLLSLSSAVQFMVTGAVLLLAVIVDSLSRRSRETHGTA